jgi:hypothetical protein
VLKDAGMKVGEYPFDVKTYGKGDWDNVALIQDGDEAYLDDTQNKTVTKDYSVPVYIYSNVKKQCIENILDIQTTVEDAILDDLSLDGNARCVNIETIEKGDRLDDFTGYEPGYSGNKVCRKLNFSVTIEQVR